MNADHDLAHEADMRALCKAQLEADCGGDMADDDSEDAFDRDARLTAYYDEQDAQVEARARDWF